MESIFFKKTANLLKEAKQPQQNKQTEQMAATEQATHTKQATPKNRTRSKRTQQAQTKDEQAKPTTRPITSSIDLFSFIVSLIFNQQRKPTNKLKAKNKN